MATEGGAERLSAVNAAAAAEGLRPGLVLAEARALLPRLAVRRARPAADARALAGLAGWAERYAPWTATDGVDGLRLDVTGVAHLFGGEDALLADLVRRLADAGIGARAAVADTAGAAWALARHAAAPTARVAPGGTAAALDGLPAAALRLPPATVDGLARLGLRRIGQLRAIPAAELTRRFGPAPARRLAEALGEADEPLSPRRPVPPFLRRLVFGEPVADPADVARAARELAERLSDDLAAAGQGARALTLALHLADGGVRRVRVGFGRPTRETRHLFRLLAERLDRLDAGFGADVATLAATVAEPLDAVQPTFRPIADVAPSPRPGRRAAAPPDAAWQADGELALLLDRLANRLGAAGVLRFQTVESHLPERSVRAVAPLAATASCAPPPEAVGPRPVRLLPAPEPVEAVAEVPDGPPLLFRWRGLNHRVRRAEGPERIAPEWWRAASLPDAAAGAAATRDYYRVEDMAGRRFWLCRLGLYRDDAAAPRWYLHGLFG